MMDHRRKWDRREYEERARAAMSLSRFDGSSDLEEEEYPTPLEYLKPRDHKINFDSFTSRKVIIGTVNTKSYASGGFHCSVCDIIVKNNLLYLDHINGRRHQKHLGMSMKVRRSTFQEVRRKLRKKNNNSEEPKTVDMKETLHEIEEEDQKMADLEEFSKNKKQMRTKDETERELPSELQEVMGFSNFVLNKKK